MNYTSNGGPAFPFEYHNQTSRHQPGFFGTGDLAPGASQQFAGMSLRDYFAAEAMVAGINDSQLAPMYSFEDHANRAYKMADAMLRAREAA